MVLKRGFLAAMLILSGVAAGQDQEIVVTASRYMRDDGGGTVSMTVIPHVTLTRRADNLVTRVRIVCDTRDPKLRDEELRQTLRDMIRTAGSTTGISLSVGADILVPFDESLIEKSIAPDGRPDTSYAEVVVKTSVAAADTFDGAVARVLAFVAATPKTGRTELLPDGRWDLTLVGPERNRSELIKLIAADAKEAAAIFGATFDVTIDGLHNPIAWYQEGPARSGAVYSLHAKHIGPAPALNWKAQDVSVHGRLPALRSVVMGDATLKRLERFASMTPTRG